MPSSDPRETAAVVADSPEPRPGPKGIAASLVILVAGALIMLGVSRSGPLAADLPLLPPLDGSNRAGAESLTIAASPPPSSLGDGVVAPADEAPAYRLKAGSFPSVVNRLASALGIDGDPDQPVTGPIAVIADRGSDRFLRVENAPGHPWQLMRGDPACLDGPDSSVSSDGSISCPSAGGATEPGQAGGSEPSSGSSAPSEPDGSLEPLNLGEPLDSGSESDEQVRCPPVDCPEGQACAQVCPEPELIAPRAEPVQLPTPQEAETRAREIVSGLGLEVARSTLSVAPDGRSWQVLAELAVEGIPAIGMDTQLSIGEDAQLVSGSGMIPDVDSLGDYPLITAGEALVRLQQIHSPNNQPPFDGREPARGEPEPAIAGYNPPIAPSGPTSVTGMRLVLLLQAAGGGPRAGAYLVPAFLVDASDGSVFTVPAATDEHLTPT